MKFIYGIEYERFGIITLKKKTAKTEDANSEFSINRDGADLTVSVKASTLPLTTTVTVRNNGQENITVKRIFAFEADAASLIPTEGAGEIQFYNEWDHIWHSVGMTNSEDSVWNLKRNHSIYNAGLVRKSDAKGVAVTFKTPHSYGAAIEYDEGVLSAFEYIDKELPPQGELSCDEFIVSEYMHFGKALKSLHSSRKSRKDVKNIRDYFGYNTWESYHSDITPEAIEKNLEAIKNTPLLRENIKYFIVDDGWELNVGDWTENEKFKEGMVSIAEKIKAAGLIPGIWSAPFLAHGDSLLVKNHPDWILKDKQGNFISKSKRAPLYILDITHPEVKIFVKETYEKFNSWGYKYYKTDFLKEALLPMIRGNNEYIENIKRYDMTVSPEESMNEMNKIIRDAIGEEAFWMGCGTQLTTNCDLMDASRVGGDISPHWARVPWQATAVSWRLLLNGHRFIADPDFTVISSPDMLEPDGIQEEYRTAPPYVFNKTSGSIFNENEVRTWLSFIIISGGLVNLSDRLDQIKPKALEYLAKVYEYAGGGDLLPVDAEKTLPRMFTRPYGDETLLAVFNWDEEPAEITVPFGGEILKATDTVTDIWTDEVIAVKENPFTVKLNARSCLLCKF